MDSKHMQRVSLYLPRDLVERTDKLKDAFDYKSRNEFYAAALESFIAEDLLQENKTAVSEKLAHAVKDFSDESAKAISKGLFRYAVELEMVMRMLARIHQVDDGELDGMRREAINNVRRTRGKIRLEEIMNGWYNEAQDELPRP